MTGSSFAKNIAGVETFNPDILETIADLSNDEVFTPPTVANNMLDTLPKHVWTNPHLKWLDPSVKTGVFLREAAKRLLEALKNPDTDDAELKHKLSTDETYRRFWVYKKMLFGLAITDLTSLMARRSLYYTKYAANSGLSVYPMDTDEGNIIFKKLKHTYAKDKNGNNKGSCTLCSASLDWDRGDELESHAYPLIHANYETIIGWFKEANADIKDEVNMKFDVIIGNPPYQLNTGGGKNDVGAVPLYHLFIKKAILMEPKYISMIVPSRWFATGRGLDSFRSEMLKDKRIREIYDFSVSSDVFPSVSIEGGVNYFLWDSSYSGKCTFNNMVGNRVFSTSSRDLSQLDILVRDNLSLPILEKILDFCKQNEIDFMNKKVHSVSTFGIKNNFDKVEANSFSGGYKLYQAFGKIAYIDKKYFDYNNEHVELINVAVGSAYGRDKYPFAVVAEPMIAEKNAVISDTFIVISSFKKQEEAENLIKYIKSKFFRFLLLQKKITQHINKEKFGYVPDLDMTQTWDDAKLYKHFGLTQDEIDHVEESIRVMV